MQVSPVAEHPRRSEFSSTPPMHSDRNLLFGILALQMEFIRPESLIAAMHVWVLTKSKPLGQVLVEHGSLTADRQAKLNALVEDRLGGGAEEPGQSDPSR